MSKEEEQGAGPSSTRSRRSERDQVLRSILGLPPLPASAELSGGQAATRSTTRQARPKEAEGRADGRSGDANPGRGPAKAAAAGAGEAAPSMAKEGEQEQRQRQQQERGPEQRAPKRRRTTPMEGAQLEAPAEDDAQPTGYLDLALLPEAVLDHVMSLLAAEAGGSRIRPTCSWLRSAFDRSNNRLVLGGPEQPQLPVNSSARLLALVRHSPRLSSLTLGDGVKGDTLPQMLKAGEPQLLRRLGSLTCHCRRRNLEALAACSGLQRLCLQGYRDHQQLDLKALTASSGTLRHLEVQGCGPVRDFSPLAACTALQHLALGSCSHLKNLTSLAPCLRLQQLQLSGSDRLHNLSPLTACAQLQALHITRCHQLADLRPLSSCAALRKLHFLDCRHISDLAPLASCTALQHLGLRRCRLVSDLSPLAACAGLRQLNLRRCTRITSVAPLASCTALQHLNLGSCSRITDLRPLAACAALQAVVLQGCVGVQSLRPLAACLGLESLDLRGCRARGRKSLAALPRLRITLD